LRETEGQRTQLGLRSFRKLASAVKIELGDLAGVPLTIKEDQIQISLWAFQTVDVEVMFEK
jgi:hypothetical protein